MIILIILAIKIDISEDDEILFIIKTNNTIDIILLKLNKMLFLELMMFIIITITDIILNMVIIWALIMLYDRIFCSNESFFLHR